MPLVKFINRWVQEKRTISQLNALSSRQLRDIGIERNANGYVRLANNT